MGRKQPFDRYIMLERHSLKVFDEALAVQEQGFAAMPESKVTPTSAAYPGGLGAPVEV